MDTSGHYAHFQSASNHQDAWLLSAPWDDGTGANHSLELMEDAQLQAAPCCPACALQPPRFNSFLLKSTQLPISGKFQSIENKDDAPRIFFQCLKCLQLPGIQGLHNVNHRAYILESQAQTVYVGCFPSANNNLGGDQKWRSAGVPVLAPHFLPMEPVGDMVF